MEPVRYGLLRPQDISERRGNPGAQALGTLPADSSRTIPDHINPSPIYSKARAEAFEKGRLAHETDCAAYYIARGPFKFSGSISWMLRADDPQRAATLTLHPLPPRTVEDLLRAGIISPSGVDEVAFKRAVEALPR
jgi:hypothetical protein